MTSASLPKRTFTQLVLGALLGMTVACNKAPSDAREWQPTDHVGEQGSAERSTGTPVEVDDDPMVALVALFRTQCANCHGERGRGDGPAGMALRPPDFTSPQFQNAWSDDDLRAVITYGRGAMPGFGDSLRGDSILKLVSLVRMFGRPEK